MGMGILGSMKMPALHALEKGGQESLEPAFLSFLDHPASSHGPEQHLISCLNGPSLLSLKQVSRECKNFVTHPPFLNGALEGIHKKIFSPENKDLPEGQLLKVFMCLEKGRRWEKEKKEKEAYSLYMKHLREGSPLRSSYVLLYKAMTLEPKVKGCLDTYNDKLLLDKETITLLKDFSASLPEIERWTHRFTVTPFEKWQWVKNDKALFRLYFLLEFFNKEKVKLPFIQDRVRQVQSFLDKSSGDSPFAFFVPAYFPRLWTDYDGSLPYERKEELIRLSLTYGDPISQFRERKKIKEGPQEKPLPPSSPEKRFKRYSIFLINQ
jgi:hypothetical protein